SAEVEARAREAGYLINAPKPNVLRLAPPLVLTETQAEHFVADLPGILDAAAADAKGARGCPANCAISCVTTTSRPPSRPRSSTWHWSWRRRRSRAARWRARAGSG